MFTVTPVSGVFSNLGKSRHGPGGLGMVCTRRLASRSLLATLFTASLVFIGSAANAQTIDPQVVEFEPSADHNVTLASGQPAVARYDLEFFYGGAVQPVQVMNIGKPAPDADGKIRIDF